MGEHFSGWVWPSCLIHIIVKLCISKNIVEVMRQARALYTKCCQYCKPLMSVTFTILCITYYCVVHTGPWLAANANFCCWVNFYEWIFARYTMQSSTSQDALVKVYYSFARYMSWIIIDLNNLPKWSIKSIQVIVLFSTWFACFSGSYDMNLSCSANICPVPVQFRGSG